MTPEIRAFEYALGLFSVLIGLAIADIAASLHRLIRARTPVAWDPLTVLAAGYALCMAIGMWFDIWTVRNVVGTRHFFFYLSLVAELFVLFLVAAASLPDDPADARDLRAFYTQNRRYFWSLVALFQLAYIGHGIYFVGGLFARSPASTVIAIWIQWLTLLAMPLVLVAAKSRVIHFIGLGVLFGVQAWHYAPYSIN